MVIEPRTIGLWDFLCEHSYALLILIKSSESKSQLVHPQKLNIPQSRVHSHLATTTQAFDVASTIFISSEMGYMVINGTVHT